MTTSAILSEIVVIWGICSASIVGTFFSSQLEISHVLNGPTTKTQHRYKGPWSAKAKNLAKYQ
jgi:hypothetical protein